MWIFYSIITAIFESYKDVQTKHASKDVDEKIAAFYYQLFSLIVILPAAIYFGIPQINPLFYPVIVIGALVNSASIILYVRALKSEHISDVIPLLAFNPVMTAFLAIFFEGRLPESKGWVGIMLVTVGLYIQKLNRKTLTHDFLKPLRFIASDTTSKAMFGVALLWSLGSYLTKISSTTSSPYFSSAISTLVTIPIFFLSMNKIQRSSVFDNNLNLKSFIPLGFVNGISKITLRLALQLGYTPFVMPIKRTNIIMTSLYGKFFLKEPFSRAKTVGLISMFVGVILLII